MSIKMPFLKQLLVFFIAALCSFLFVDALYLYPGSKLYYLLFSVSYFLLLGLAIKSLKSYSFLFLAVFLWLGFWLKLTMHTVFNYPYVEDTGNFVFTGKALDEVLLVATMGALGILFAYSFVGLLRLKSTVFVDSSKEINVPLLYQKHKNVIFGLLILVVISLAVLNIYFGIFQTGLTTRTKLVWPFSALVYWLLGIGLALITSTLLWWNLLIEKRASGFFIGALSEPFFVSISVLSRFTFIFHFIPVFLAFILNKAQLQLRIKPRALSAFLLLSGTLFLISLQSVSSLRNYYYEMIPDNNKNRGSVFVTMFKGLVIDRWLGVEGVMAVASYPEKSRHLLEQGILEKPDTSKIGMYQYIAHSKYTSIDTKRFIFSTVPGAVGFFYYSGSLAIVFIALFGLTLLMQLAEVLIAVLTNNVLIIALIGMDLANTVAQFGINPTLIIKQLLLIFAYCLLLHIVQRDKLHAGVTNLDLMK
jgi:hypothetical protein